MYAYNIASMSTGIYYTVQYFVGILICTHASMHAHARAHTHTHTHTHTTHTHARTYTHIAYKISF